MHRPGTHCLMLLAAALCSVSGAEGEGMGEFTIFTWGNGAAAEARNRVRDHYGDVFVDRARGQAFGIDSIAATLEGGRLLLRDLAGSPRELRVVFDDGAAQSVHLDGEAAVMVD